MWILRPYLPAKPLSVDLSFKIVYLLGGGVDLFVSFLLDLSQSVIAETDSVSSPPLALCRICERYIPTWWFERHSEVCLVEHKFQSDLDAAHENLLDQRNTIVRLLGLMDSKSSLPVGESPPAPSPISVVTSNSFNSASPVSSMSSHTSSSSSPSISKLEYRGYPLPVPNQSPSSETSSPPRSPRMMSQLGSSKRMLVKSFNLPKRSPIKLMELLLELCDLAVDINNPEIRAADIANNNAEIRTHSPQSESKIHRVLNWITPHVEDHGLALLCEDTVKYARQKVDAAVRLGNAITYLETIRHESEALVTAAIEDTIEKANLQRANEEMYQSVEGEQGDNEDGEDTDIDETSSLFSESYLTSDALPQASTPISRRETNQGLRQESSFSGETQNLRSHTLQARSMTPKSLLSESYTSSTSVTRPKDSDSKQEQQVTLDPNYSLDFHLADLDLNSTATYNRVQKKKSISNMSTVSSSSQGGPSSWTSLQRNRIHIPSTDVPFSPSTPLSSPLIFPHDAFPLDLNHRRQSSVNSDIARAPVSPLLTSTVFSNKPAPPSIKDYEIISPISKGAFGSVFLAKKRLTGEYFAIKVLKKADMIAKNQVMNVRAERAIMMSQSDSPFVAKLYFTFQSKNYLYLVMEYLNGGDCAALVKVLGGLPEEWAQKYIAEVVLGVEDLHKKGIIHRDLKPDNLLINQDGHLKLTDFGLSRMGLVGRHTHHHTASTLDSSASFESGSSGNVLFSKPIAKSLTNPDVNRPSSTSSAGSLSGPNNALLDSSISLVPGYFNIAKPDYRSKLSRSESINSNTGEALFHGSLLLDNKQEEDNMSSASSDAGGSLGSGDPSAVSTAGAKTIPLFDPLDTTRKFVGTPDYLAPETIRGVGQDEMSDWWSIGCILFEFLYGYPPFHAGTPPLVFENILQHNIQWPEGDDDEMIEVPHISDEARDLIEKLLCPEAENRLGAKGGADEIRAHPFFSGINWDTLWDEEASFIPSVEDPESTDYFDSRGAEAQAFPEDPATQDEEVDPKSEVTPIEESVRSGRSSRLGSSESSASMQRKDQRAKVPLHIPPHVRDNRNRRLSESVSNDDFGNFVFKNLPMLDKANKDTLSRIKTENLEHRNSIVAEPNLRGRGLSISTNPVFKRPDSPSMGGVARHTSPVRVSNTGTGSGSGSGSGSSSSQPTSMSISLPPVVAATSTASSSTNTSNMASPHRKVYPVKPWPSAPLSVLSTSPLSIECPKSSVLSNYMASSPLQSPNLSNNTGDSYLPPPVSGSKLQTPISPNSLGFRRLSNMESSPELGEQFRKKTATPHRYSKVFDPSPSNSDTEDARGSALLRIQKRREHGRKSSSFSLLTPTYRPLIVLICESNPVWRYSMETLLKGLNCRFVTVTDTADAIRYATGDLKFDVIFTEFKFPKTNGADVARIIHSTSSSNTETPVVCVTSYATEASNAGRSNFSSIVTKPPTRQKICEALERHCSWKPKELKLPLKKVVDEANAEIASEVQPIPESSTDTINETIQEKSGKSITDPVKTEDEPAIELNSMKSGLSTGRIDDSTNEDQTMAIASKKTRLSACESPPDSSSLQADPPCSDGDAHNDKGSSSSKVGSQPFSITEEASSSSTSTQTKSPPLPKQSNA